jgi:hypothetical protein
VLAQLGTHLIPSLCDFLPHPVLVMRPNEYVSPVLFDMVEPPRAPFRLAMAHSRADSSVEVSLKGRSTAANSKLVCYPPEPSLLDGAASTVVDVK